jgi:small subunit ribosomal protein S5
MFKKGPHKRKDFSSGKREIPEFDHKVIDIRRVARVVAGGRRFNFRVTVVAGNKKGEVGVGLGKGADTSMAIEKALRNAKKLKVKIPLTKNRSIPFPVEAKYASAYIFIMPAREGRGLVAGSSLRTVLDLAGVNDVTAKIISRSKNKLNIARATIKALKIIK